MCLLKIWYKVKLTLHQILAGSRSGHTCCRRELAIHWPHTAHTVAVDSHRAGSTVPIDCTQPEGHRQREMVPIDITFMQNQ